MRPGDQAALVSFESRVHYDLSFTDDKEELIQAIQSLRPQGMTALYDGLAKAIQILQNQSGSRAVIFLTDGNDNSSNFRARDIRQMNIGEGIQCYGIGLGEVDHNEFRRIVQAAHGQYEVAGQSSDLLSLYKNLQSTYYQQDFSGTGSLSITSVPSGVDVLVDGTSIGLTPVMMARQLPRTVSMELKFQKKSWLQEVEIREGYRGIIRGREDALLPDLIIETTPLNSAVFIDDSYVGLSSAFPSPGSDHSNQLTIENIQPGWHSFRIVAVPDVDLSASQVFEFEVNLDNMSAYMNVAVFMKRANLIYNNGKRDQVTADPMLDIQGSLDRFDSLFGN
jgi:hypothetical protein